MMMMGWGMILHMIFWIVVVGMIIYAVLQMVSKPFEKKQDPALHVLRERFARGEINEEEFKQKKLVLASDRSA
jgi:putative membrane protein